MVAGTMNLSVLLSVKDAFSGGFKNAQGQLNQLSMSTEQLGQSMVAGGKQMMMTGAIVTGLGVAGLYSAKKFTDAFASFDQAMRNTMSVSELTEEEFVEMSATAKEWAKIYGFSAEAVASGMYQVASAGFSTREELELMTPVLLRLAKAAGTDFYSAATYATDMMAGFGKGAADLERITDIMMGTVMGTKNTLESFGQAMSYAAPVAKTLGWSMEEAAAFIGVFADMGVRGTRAGTGFRMMMRGLVSPSAEAKAIMERLGLSFVDMEGNVLSLTEILNQLKESEAGVAEITEIFGMRVGPYIAGMTAKGGEGVVRFNELLGQLEESAGAAGEAFDIQMMGTANVMNILKVRAEEATLALGEGLAVGMEIAYDAVAQLGEAIAGLPEPVRKVIGVVWVFGSAIASVVGPMIILLGLRKIMIGQSLLIQAQLGKEAVQVGILTRAKQFLATTTGILTFRFAGLWAAMAGIGLLIAAFTSDSREMQAVMVGLFGVTMALAAAFWMLAGAKVAATLGLAAAAVAVGVAVVLGLMAQFGMAEGGIVRKPTMALLGEKGTEYVIPKGKVDKLPSLGGGGTRHFHVGQVRVVVESRDGRVDADQMIKDIQDKLIEMEQSEVAEE